VHAEYAICTPQQNIAAAQQSDTKLIAKCTTKYKMTTQFRIASTCLLRLQSANHRNLNVRTKSTEYSNWKWWPDIRWHTSSRSVIVDW